MNRTVVSSRAKEKGSGSISASEVYAWHWHVQRKSTLTPFPTLLMLWALLAAVACTPQTGLAAATSAATAADPLSVQSPWQPPASTAGGSRDDFHRALQVPVEGMLQAARSIDQRLLGWGQRLLALLTGLALVWIGLKAMLDPGAIGELMTEFITLLLVSGLLFALLDNWGSATAAIVGGTADLARQVSGSVHDGAAAVHGLQRVVDAGFALWEHPGVGLFAISDPVGWLLTLGFKLAILLLLLACGIIYLGMYLLSMTLLSIAFALGPVLIPWSIIAPASFLFDAWVRFTLIAALYQVVGIVIVTLVSQMHESTLAGLDAAIGGTSGVFNFYYFAAAFLLSGVSALMMLQIPSIAGGLVNGTAALRVHVGGRARSERKADQTPGAPAGNSSQAGASTTGSASSREAALEAASAQRTASAMRSPASGGSAIQ